MSFDDKSECNHGANEAGTHLSPFLKNAVKGKVKKNRLARGDNTPLKAVFEKPVQYQLREDELERIERRKKQNREAAQRCRDKKKRQIVPDTIEKSVEDLIKANGQQRMKIFDIRRELEELKAIVLVHERSGQCLLSQTSQRPCPAVKWAGVGDQQVPQNVSWSNFDSPSSMQHVSYDGNDKYKSSFISCCQDSLPVSNLGSGQSTSCWVMQGQGHEPTSGYMENVFQAGDESPTADDKYMQLPNNEQSTDIKSYFTSATYAQTNGVQSCVLPGTATTSRPEVVEQPLAITGSDPWLFEKSRPTPDVLPDEATARFQTITASNQPDPEVIPSNLMGIPSLDEIPINDLVSCEDFLSNEYSLEISNIFDRCGNA